MLKPNAPLSVTRSVAFVTILWLLIFALRLAAPPTLTDDDQERPASYILDVVRNGNWVVQVDDTGDVTSKPPMYTWLSAASAVMWGRLDVFTLYLPCALAMLGVAWMTLAVGWRHFSPAAGLIAATIFLVSMPTFLLVTLARTDPTFVFFTVAGTLLLWRLWETGRGTFSFWILASLATLTKGPLGLILALGGLLALAWERWRPGDGSLPVGVLKQPLVHVLGIVLLFALNLGWLWWAQSVLGDAVTEKLIGRELAAHSTGASDGITPGTRFYRQAPILVLRFLPWSIPAVVGVWLLFRQPSQNARTRRFERFIGAYLLFGLFIFSMAGHQRQVHLMPLMFAMALLGGRVLADWIVKRNWTVFNLKGAVATLIFATLFNIGYTVSRVLEDEKQYTEHLMTIAERATEAFGSSVNVTILDATYAFQFPDNTHVPRSNTWRANVLLSGEVPAFVAVQRWKRLDDTFDEQRPTLYRFGMTPNADFGTDHVEIVSNHPRLETPDSLATYIGDVRVEMHGAVVAQTGPLNNLRFHATRPEGRIILTNESEESQSVRVRVVNARDDSAKDLQLPFWQPQEIAFTADADYVGLPTAESPSLVRRGGFLTLVAIAILLGAIVTRSSMMKED